MDLEIPSRPEMPEIRFAHDDGSLIDLERWHTGPQQRVHIVAKPLLGQVGVQGIRKVLGHMGDFLQLILEICRLSSHNRSQMQSRAPLP
jgi:hypothetical protein